MAGREKGDDAPAPGAVAPPPVIYAAGFAVGYLVDLAVPLGPIPVVVGGALGGLMIVVSVAVVLWAFRSMRRAGTTINVYRSARALVATGPYQYSRNPMYLALTLLYLGLALVFDVVWVLLLLPAVVAVLHHGVIVREEVHLERAFGQEYRDYKARVRRWL